MRIVFPLPHFQVFNSALFFVKYYNTLLVHKRGLGSF